MKPAARSRRALTPEAAAALILDEAGEGTTVTEGTDSEGCVGARLAMVLFRAVQAVVLPAEAVQMVVFLTMATVVMLALLVVHGAEVVVGAREVVDELVLMVVLKELVLVLVLVMLVLVLLVLVLVLVRLVLVGAGLAVAATRPVTV